MKNTSLLFAMIVVAVGACAPVRGEQLFERPGVRAYLREQRVEIDARATGIEPGNPVEFVLIGSASGHDYEALAVTEARAEHIKAALEQVGLKAGWPVDERKMQFWPRGDRLDISVKIAADDAGEGGSDNIPINRLLFDAYRDAVPESFPFVFVGSSYIPAPGDPSEPVLAADSLEPYAIISAYNEATTLIDLARRAPQSSEYGRTLPNPAKLIGKGASLKFVLVPRKGADAFEDVDLALEINASDDGGIGECVLLGLEGLALNDDNRTMAGVLSQFSQMIEKRKLPHVGIEFDGALRIDTARELARMLVAVDTEAGIRVAPPPDGQLYYKAFLPEPVMADREQRSLQPPELLLKGQDGGLFAVLKKADREWDEDVEGESRIIVEEWDVEGIDDLKQLLKEHAGEIPILLVYAPESLRLRVLMDYVRPVFKDYPTVFVLPSEWDE